MNINSVFVDANILIDLKDKNRKNFESVLAIFNYLVEQNIKIFTSCDLITTIYYILSKQNKQYALESIEQINKICKIIQFSNKELLQTTQLMREDKNFKDLEDTIQYVLAKTAKCNIILSNDKNFYSPEIKCFTSEKFIMESNR